MLLGRGRGVQNRHRGGPSGGSWVVLLSATCTCVSQPPGGASLSTPSPFALAAPHPTRSRARGPSCRPVAGTLAERPVRPCHPRARRWRAGRGGQGRRGRRSGRPLWGQCPGAQPGPRLRVDGRRAPGSPRRAYLGCRRTCPRPADWRPSRPWRRCGRTLSAAAARPSPRAGETDTPVGARCPLLEVDATEI